MSIQEVVVHSRKELGKGPSGRLRREGLIPCVVYGMGLGANAISVEPKAVSKILRSEKGMNTVLNLRLEGTEESRHVMIKTVDRHPVSDRLTHADFMRIDMEKEVHATIALEMSGLPVGVKLGGILTIVRHEIDIVCKPKHLLGAISVDVSSLGMDEAVRVSDLPVFEGVTYQLDPSRTLAVVHAPDKSDPVEDGAEAEADAE